MREPDPTLAAPAAAPPAPGAVAAGLALIASAACWGGTAVATKRLLEDVPPVPMLVAQLVGSVAFLWAAGWILRIPVPLHRAARRAALSGMLEPGLAYTAGVVALSLTTASSVALIGATETPMILLLAWIFLRERPGTRTLLLAALAGVGVGLLMLPDLAGTGRGSILGDALMVLSTLIAAVYVIVSRRLVAGVAPLPLATLQQSVGLGWALLALGGAWAAGWSPGLGGLPLGKLALSALTGVFQYALAFWFWLHGLRRFPAGRAGLFLTLIPLFGVAGAAALLGERLSLAQWVGGAVVVGTVVGMVREEEGE